MATDTVYIPLGNVLVATSDSTGVGSYSRVGDPGGTLYAPVAIVASTAYTIGPFNEPRTYRFDYTGGLTKELSYSGVYAATDEADLDLKAPLASPTFTGTVVLPSTTSIGDVSALEIGYSNGVTSAIQTQIDAKAPTLVTSNVGAVSAGAVATEYGDGYQHTTRLAITSTLPAIAGGAALSVGKLLYTFPAGAIVVDRAYMSVGITQTEAHINADTPDVGLGTTIAAGANALVSDTGSAENILTGQTAANCTGTATVKTVADQVLVIEAAGDHTVYLNVADDWAADGDAAAAIAGTVVLHWHFMA